MDRPIVYTLEGLRSTDVLTGWRSSLIGLAKLSEAVFGTSTVLDGLGCAPGTGLNVSIAPGMVYQTAVVDASTYGSLGADSHTILKQGLLLDAATLACPAPGAAGQSINYLIQVQLQETDGGSTTPPFYNSANPSVRLYPTVNTLRQDLCVVQVKAGTAATTGSQVTPPPDAGWVGAWVVTVANGQSSISSGNISAYSGAPFIGARLRDLLMLMTVQTDTGAANALVINPQPALSAYTNGLQLTVLAANTNTGASTINVSGLGAKAIVQTSGAALAPRQIVAGAILELAYNGTNFVLGNAPAVLDGSAFATAAGTANALTATIASPFSAYVTGQRVSIKATSANTSSATINLNSLGAKSIVRAGGAALVANDILNGSILDLIYDGTSFVLLNPGKAIDGWSYVVAGGSANALTATTSAPLPAYVAGVALDVLATVANTGAATINLNGLGAKSIVNYDGSALVAGEISVGMVLRLVYNGTNFVFQNAPFGPTPPVGSSDGRFATMAALAAGIAAVANYRYIAATTAIPLASASFYAVDTSGGSVTAPLPTSPNLGDVIVFVDVAKVWSTNPFILGRNGKTIMGLSEDLTCNIANLQFAIWWNGTTWVLF